MNKAITDGVQLTPSPFANGLDVWSRGDGIPGSDTYATASNAAFVPADADFGGALELQKNNSVQKLRYMGETPLLPGCYLRITARIKAISGNLPAVRIAAWAGGAGGSAVQGIATTGPSTQLTEYGSVYEVSAIVGAGNRNGVDLVWGPDAIYGHFGLDLTGSNGGVVRIDDIEIEDVTNVFLREIVSIVDVRDYGAVGDGTTDDSNAFSAANSDAQGRTLFVPAGVFYLGNDVTINTPVKFEGRVTMPADKMLLLQRNFDFPTYMEAFEDEALAFQKGFQALLNNVDHESFDLGGRKIKVFSEIDMQAAVPNRTSYSTRRIIRNGQIDAQGDDWDTEVFTSQATYNANDNRKLKNVANVANIPVGSIVEGNGVGREVYVREKNISKQEITLNAPLFDAEGTQTFTFRRFKYMLNFNGFSSLAKFGIHGVEFQGNTKASGILLADSGSSFELLDCFFSRAKDRGITSPGGGCQGIIIDRCQFLSAEESLTVPNRTVVGFNVNANDAKIRGNRATPHRHWCLIAGQNNIITNNHFFQGDSVPDGVRTAGIILAATHTSSLITANYIDNCFIEWTNEQDSAPEQSGEFSFSSLSITDNVFLSGDVSISFNYIVVKPHGAGHYLNGVCIANNRFRSINGGIARVEGIDTSFADLDTGRHRNVQVFGNSFHNVTNPVENPLFLEHTQSSTSTAWTIDTGTGLPFEGFAQEVDSIVPTDNIRNNSNATTWGFPHVDVEQGSQKQQIRLNWQESVRGRVRVVVRMDQR